MCLSFRNCLDNKTVWTTFHLNQTVNLNDLLNVSKVRLMTLKNPFACMQQHADESAKEPFARYTSPFVTPPFFLTQYTGEIQGIFDKADITLEAITILTPSDKSQLTDFSSKAAALDMSTVTTEVGVCVSPQESLGHAHVSRSATEQH